MSFKIKTWLGSLIPGIITVAVVFGPSKITITSKLGAQFGYSLLWIIVIAIFFMIVFTGISARIGLATSRSLLTIIRDRWGNWASRVIGIGIFLVTASFQIGNAIGSGIAVAEFTNTRSLPWIIVTSALGILLLFAKKFYKVLSRLMVSVVVFMLFSFLVTCFLSHPRIPEIIGGLKPQVPPGSEGLVIAFVASCFSIVGAFYQSYLVQQRAVTRSREEREEMKDRSITGMLLLGLMCAAVMICAASVLKPKGTIVLSGADMGRALEPLFGLGASKLFLLGLFGSSFSTLVGNATLGGTLLADAFGYGHDLNAKPVKICIAAIISIGAILACIFGTLPLQMIVFAQGVTIFIVPVIGIALLVVSCDKKIMGSRTSGPFSSIAGVSGIILLLFLAVLNGIKLFFHS